MMTEKFHNNHGLWGMPILSAFAKKTWFLGWCVVFMEMCLPHGSDLVVAQAHAGSSMRATGPSFDCARAKNRIDVTICANDDLSLLDRQLGLVYHAALAAAPAEDADKIRKEGVAWIRNVRNQCTSSECLHAVYTDRIASVSALSGAMPCLPYASKVNLTGKLVRLTSPGPPNYESIAHGDAPETGFYLKLARPICTKDSSIQQGGDNGVEDVSLVQLILDGENGYAAHRPFLGKTITLTGRLMTAITGHHHAPLLLDMLPSR